MSKSGVAHMLLYPTMVLLLAYHQVLCYCSIVVMQGQTLTWNARVETVVMKCHCGQNVMAEISAHSLVSSLWSSSVHFDPQSLSSSHNLRVVSNYLTCIWNGTNWIEWNDEHKTVAANSCNWLCSVYVELLNVSLGSSHHRGFMS